MSCSRIIPDNRYSLSFSLPSKGIIPRITRRLAFRVISSPLSHQLAPRRLNDAERRSMVKSGAVFIFATEESGIKRWTEGLAWSPSRIDGNFLVSLSNVEASLSVRGIGQLSCTKSSSTDVGFLQIYREVTQTVERGSHKSAVNSPVSTASLPQDQHASVTGSQYDSTLGPVKPNGLTKRVSFHSSALPTLLLTHTRPSRSRLTAWIITLSRIIKMTTSVADGSSGQRPIQQCWLLLYPQS